MTHDGNGPESDGSVEVVEGDLVDAEPVTGEIVDGDVVDDLAAESVAAELGLDLPTDPEAAQAMLLEQLHQARQEANDYLQSLQRVAAEFENYRKRVERDQLAMVQRASERVVVELLPALDNFDAGLDYETQTPAEEKILDGMRGTYEALMTVLGKEGLAAIEAEGATFDPALHEAVGGAVGGAGDLVVSQELRKGYTLAGRVIRPSLVMVEHA